MTGTPLHLTVVCKTFQLVCMHTVQLMLTMQKRLEKIFWMIWKDKVYTFKRKNQVITLGMKSLVKIDGSTVQIDPQLLFQ